MPTSKKTAPAIKRAKNKVAGSKRIDNKGIEGAGQGGILPPVEHRFKPGQSGNPSGRPKLLSQSYKDWLSAQADGYQNGTTNSYLVAQAIGAQAKLGDVPSAREIRSATEGDLLKVFQGMDDAELDAFIAERQRVASIGDDGTGETPSEQTSVSG